MEEIKAEETKPNNNNKKRLGAVVLAVLVIMGAVAIFFYMRYKAVHITTDDAYVDGNVHTIASKVSWTVKVIYVKSNQFVKKGDLLVDLDPADYEAKVNEASSGVGAEKGKLIEAETRISVSKNRLDELSAALGTAKANLELQEANLKQAERDSRRAENLYK